MRAPHQILCGIRRTIKLSNIAHLDVCRGLRKARQAHRADETRDRFVHRFAPVGPSGFVVLTAQSTWCRHGWRLCMHNRLRD
jgi:hypothetical protein